MSMSRADGCERMAGRSRAAAGRAALALEIREARELRRDREGKGGGEGVKRWRERESAGTRDDRQEERGGGGDVRDQALPVQECGIVGHLRCSRQCVEHGAAVGGVQVDTVKH